ncbi:hypothetical protein ABZX40_38435 [Streptomyces sp. NPDC004610]|uniref:hypothetical protein n=1 Tax=unclassified Streptomyces TaxID=2593676 RepID=UPI0033B0148D
MEPNHPSARKRRKRLITILRWAARRRRTALVHALRGACYGVRAGAVSLVSVWVQRLL